MIRSPLLKLGGMRTANKGDRKYNLALAYKSADLTATKQVPFEFELLNFFVLLMTVVGLALTSTARASP